MFALGMLFNILQRGNASLTRIYKVLDTEDDVNDDGNDVIGNTDMNFDDVSFTYPLSKRENLRQVRVSISYAVFCLKKKTNVSGNGAWAASQCAGNLLERLIRTPTGRSPVTSLS